MRSIIHKCYIYKLKKYGDNYAKILGITIQNLVPQVIWCPKFVDLCDRPSSLHRDMMDRLSYWSQLFSQRSCPCACYEGIWGDGDVAPLILNSGTRWRWVVSFKPWLLYQWGNNPQYPLSASKWFGIVWSYFSKCMTSPTLSRAHTKVWYSVVVWA